jgi:hypothetical protein
MLLIIWLIQFAVGTRRLGRRQGVAPTVVGQLGGSAA